MNVNHHLHGLASAATLADKHSAPVTHLWSRVIGTLVMLLVIVGIYLLMWRGWKNRQARQANVPPLPEAPESVLAGAGAGREQSGSGRGIEATYVSTTSEGDWLDRIAVHRLGERGAAEVHVAPAGVLIKRAGTTDVFIPAAAVRGIRRTTGLAGKYLREEGIVVITWQHGDRTLDTGLKPRFETEDLVRVLETELAVTATETERPAS